MTYHEALQEAMRRWGDQAYIRNQPGKRDPFRVGKEIDEIFWVEGAGKSWTEAFRAADQNGKNPKRRRR